MAKIAILGFGTVGSGVYEVLCRNAAGRGRNAACLSAGQKLLGPDDLEENFRQDLCIHQIKTAFQLVHLSNTSVLAENIIASDSLHCKRSDAILSDYPVLSREVPLQRTESATRCAEKYDFCLSRCRGQWLSLIHI